MEMKECMTLEQKKRLLIALKSLKEEYTGNVGGETDIANADNLVAEDEFTAAVKPERNIIAKTFDTQGDFDSYVNQRRGIEITPKEQQAILGLDSVRPTQQSKFFIEFETTDNFGKNNTTIIKKLKQGNQFCWTAFSKYEGAEDKNKPEGSEDESPEKEETPEKEEEHPKDLGLKEQSPSNNELTVNDSIRITKTNTFVNDTQGADILSDFLKKLDI